MGCVMSQQQEQIQKELQETRKELARLSSLLESKHKPMLHSPQGSEYDLDRLPVDVQRQFREVLEERDMYKEKFEVTLRDNLKPRISVHGTEVSTKVERKTRNGEIELQKIQEHVQQHGDEAPPNITVASRRSIISNPNMPMSKKAHFRILRCNDLECVYESRKDGMILTTQSSQNLVRLLWVTPPQTVLVVKKPGEDRVMRYFLELIAWLHERYSAEIFIEPKVLEEKNVVDAGYDFLQTWKSKEELDTLHERIDYIVCLGGDGTILWTSGLFNSSVPPIISFAMGTLGFLTPFPIEEYKASLSQLMESGFILTLRSRLMCRIVRRNNALLQKAETHEAAATEDLKNSLEQSEVYFALNEVVIDRGASSLVYLDCYCNNIFFTQVYADGIIIATPTGSTAYSLSAGGSMVHPEVPAMCFTPICPHSLSFRPVLFPDSVTLKIGVSPDSRSEPAISFDGRRSISLKKGDYVEVNISQFPVPSICREGETEDWFDAIQGILQWNKRGADHTKKKK